MCPYRSRLFVAGIFSWLLFLPVLKADDWPTWRHDASRTAATDQVLPDTLHLQWSRQLPPPKAAWPEDPRLMFDATYEPIVVGDFLYLASAQTNGVTAYNTRTGEERWRYFATGPVRFAPVYDSGKLYFGCDGGQLYCVDSTTGKLNWKIDAAATSRKVIGNDRLISVWPIRGGPVIHDHKLYFTAGVWPFEGNFLYTVDLKSDAIPPACESVTLAPKLLPQGYLAANETNLLIPGGRGKVRRMDFASKRIRNINYDSRAKTDYHVTASSKWMFHGDKVVDLVANREIPFELYKPVTHGSILYGSIKHKVVGGIDIAKPVVAEGKDAKGEPIQVSRFDAYAFTPDVDGKPVDPETAIPIRIALKAGNRLFGFQDKTVFSTELPGPLSKPGVAKPAWSRTIDGHPSSMIAADDRLFVTTAEGQLFCFGAEKTAQYHYQRPAEKITGNDRSTFVASLVHAAKTKTGYCVVMGLDDGKMVDELVLQTDMRILVLDKDPARIQALRNRLTDAGVYGSRVDAFVGDPLIQSLPPYIANLVVSEDWSRAGLDRGRTVVEAIYKSLRPYGGVACFELGHIENQDLEQWASTLSRSSLQQDGQLAVLSREGALEGAGTWSDEYGSPANTLMSSESRVKAPLGVLWFGGPASDPSLFYDRHQWASSAIIVSGRMIIQGPQKLTAVDVYTGRILWQIPLKKGLSPGRRAAWESTGFHFLATDDRIYLVYEKACQVFDAASGERINVFKLEDPDHSFGRIRIWENWLIVPAFTKHPEFGPVPSQLIAMDRYDGETVWNIKTELSFPFVAVGKDKFFVFEGLLQDLYANRQRKGVVPAAAPEKYLAAYEVLSGKRLWRKPTDRIVTWLAYSQPNDVLIASDKAGIEAWRSSGGTKLWSKQSDGVGFRGHPENLWDKVIIWNDRIIDQRGPGKSYNIMTGEPIVQLHPLTGSETDWAFTKVGHHCNYAIASEHLMTFRADSAAFLDLDNGGTSHLQGFRAGCRNSLIPADGVLNAPNFANGCICSYSLFTSLALVHVPEAEQWSYSPLKTPADPITQIGINFGAPGDRSDGNGTLWMDYPSVGGSSPDVQVNVEGPNLKWFRNHASKVESGELRWVGSSGVEGLTKLTVKLDQDDSINRKYKVRLLFMDPGQNQIGDRQFEVSRDNQVLLDVDVVKETGGNWRNLIKEFDLENAGVLEIDFSASAGRPLLSGVEIVEYKSGTNLISD